MSEVLLESGSHWLWKTTVEGSILIGLVLLAIALLGRNLGPRWRIALWVLVGVKLEPEADSGGPPTKPKPTVIDTRATVLSLSETARDLMRTLRDPESEATPLEKAKVASSLATTLSLIGKMTGETAPLTTERILRSPQWREVADAAVKSLEPFPDALRAFGEAMGKIA